MRLIFAVGASAFRCSFSGANLVNWCLMAIDDGQVVIGSCVINPERSEMVLIRRPSLKIGDYRRPLVILQVIVVACVRNMLGET